MFSPISGSLYFLVLPGMFHLSLLISAWLYPELLQISIQMSPSKVSFPGVYHLKLWAHTTLSPYSLSNFPNFYPYNFLLSDILYISLIYLCVFFHCSISSKTARIFVCCVRCYILSALNRAWHMVVLNKHLLNE